MNANCCLIKGLWRIVLNASDAKQSQFSCLSGGVGLGNTCFGWYNGVVETGVRRGVS